MVQVSINGKTADITKENGSITKCMEKASISGKMAGSMKEDTTMTKNMARGSTTGLEGRYLKGSGCMGREKEWADL